jgi:hypothetical protein
LQAHPLSSDFTECLLVIVYLLKKHIINNNNSPREIAESGWPSAALSA